MLEVMNLLKFMSIELVMRWLESITGSMDTNLSKLQKIVEDRGAWHAAVHVVTKSWTQLRLKNNKRKITSGR